MQIHQQHLTVMRGFGTILLIALFVSLKTERAYFRKFISKKDSPLDYWATVGSYAVLAFLGLILPLFAKVIR